MKFKETKKVLLIVLVLNWVVAFIKIGLGLFSGILSITADGLHSLFDGFSNVLGFFGIKIAERPPDKTHPYGYRKYEEIAALGILLLLIVSAWELIKNIAERFSNPIQPEVSFIYLGALVLCIIIDWLAARYEYTKGRELKSTILVADSSHTKSHILTTLAVIVGTICILFGFPILDPIVASIVVLMIGKIGYEVFKEASGILSDKAIVDEEKIEEIVGKIKGVSFPHNIRSRGDESHIFLDMHICIDSTLSVNRAHELSASVKEEIQRQVPEIKDIVMHVEPDIKANNCVCK